MYTHNKRTPQEKLYDVQFKCTEIRIPCENEKANLSIGDWVVVERGKRNKHLGKVVKIHTTTRNLHDYRQTDKPLEFILDRPPLKEYKDFDLQLQRYKEKELLEELNNYDTKSFMKWLDVEYQYDERKIVVFFEPLDVIKQGKCNLEIFKYFLKIKQNISTELMMKLRKRIWFQQINYPEKELLKKESPKQDMSEAWNLVKSNLHKLNKQEQWQ